MMQEKEMTALNPVFVKQKSEQKGLENVSTFSTVCCCGSRRQQETFCTPSGALTGRALLQEFSGPEPNRSPFGDLFLRTQCTVFEALSHAPFAARWRFMDCVRR
jgi:hypothetical protein